MRLWLILGILLLTADAHAQVVQLQGGASNLLQAAGGTVSYSTDRWASEFDLGVSQNQMVLGAGIHFRRRGCDWFAGDHVQNYSTAVAGLSAASRGVAITCQNKTHSLQFFSGATGDTRSTAFFQTQRSRHFGSGLQYSQKFGDWTLGSVAAFAGGDRVLLEDIRFHHRAWAFDEAAGWADHQKYFEVTGTYSTRHFAANLTHADYFGIASSNSEQVSIGISQVSVFGSAFQSKASGQAFGGIIRPTDWISGTVMHLMSPSGSFTSEFITENILQHWTLTQAISGRNVNFGGGYQGNLFSASVGYSEVFNPTGGFEQAMTFSLRLQLTRGTIDLSVSRLPSGLFYTGSAGLVVQGPALGGTPQQTNMAP